jgi:hypothetical protein
MQTLTLDNATARRIITHASKLGVSPESIVSSVLGEYLDDEAVHIEFAAQRRAQGLPPIVTITAADCQ